MINDKARALTAQIESSVNALAAETDAVRKSETFLTWLNAMAQFHAYSWNNQFLISIQCPGASKVAGFQTWKKLGRNVKKGWDLEDRSSDEFMKDFYKHLGHESKTEALRDAELDLSRSGSAPYYWASYELVGDPTSGEVLAK